MIFKSTETPKGLRAKLAYFLVWLAGKIYPDSPATAAFWASVYVDTMIYGNSFVLMKPDEVILSQHNTAGGVSHGVWEKKK